MRSNCPRCAGFVWNEWGDVHCLICGWYDFPPNPMPIDNPHHRWESVVCDKCHERKAMRGRARCRQCAGHGFTAAVERHG